MFIVLLLLHFATNIGIATYFAYYKYMNRNKENVSRRNCTYQTDLLMKEVKKINLKSEYHYFEVIINIENFHSNLLGIEKKSHKDIDMYYIDYITIKKFDDCENIHSINPLYLVIHSGTGHFKEKYGEKYLIIDSTKKYEEVFSEIKSEIETINSGKELFHEKNYVKIGVNTDDDLSLNKKLKFPTLTKIIRCILQKGEKLYPEICLGECLCEL